MSLKALPHDVRALLCASAQINNYKRAIEELVYNSLDAESTSIAIRVNIAENRIHVIDNGCGIMKNDFDSLGVRYMTSKLTDIATLKSIPKCYGYRGEFLANIIEISQCVKITSRYKDVEEAWTQTFYQGKKRSVVKMSTRPSKGTTIEIKGFLYNLNIQKQGIDAVNDLQNVKAFLEQLAIVHNDISLSLRDDSRNEIVFKIHKKRDVYQTLLTLFDINKGDVQELQIVKSQYKAIAYFGKRDTTIGRHWVYVNGKFIENNSKLHKIIYGYLKKYLILSDRNELKSRNHRKEEHLFKSSIPFYFILITCPYIDYDVSFASCQSVIEFKNWEQITLLLEKLIKFYVGDVNIKHVQRTKENVRQTNISTTKKNDDTSGKIKNIINKILGTNSKKLKISQLQHGKLIKRKRRQKSKGVSRENVFLKINEVSELKSINVPEENMNLKSKHKENLKIKNDKINNIDHNKTIPKNKRISEKLMDIRNTNKKDVITLGIKTSKIKKNKKKKQNKVKNLSFVKTVHAPVIKNNLNEMKPNEISKSKDINRELQDLEETNAVVTKSRNDNQKVDEFYKCQCNCYVTRPNHVNQKSSKTELRGVKFQVPLPPKTNKNAIVKYEMKVNPFKTTYDLVKTILEIDQERRYCIDDNSLEIGIEVDPISNHRQTSVRLPMNRLTLNDTISNYTDTYCRKDKRSILKDKNPWYDTNNIMPGHFVSYNLTCEKTYSTKDITKSNAKRQCKSKDTYNFYSASNESVQYSLKCADIFKENSYEYCTQNNPSSYLSNTQALSKLTYDSHNYNNFYQQIYNVNRHHNEGQNIRFITNQSKDNFMSSNSKYLHKKCFKNKIKKSLAKRTQYYSKHDKQTIDESYIIEFTTSNEMKCSKKQEEITLWNQSRVSMFNVGDNNFKYDSYSPIHEPTINFGNTYTIPTYSICSGGSSHAVYHNNNTHQHAHKVCESNCVRCPNMKRNDTVVIEKEKTEEKESHDTFTASKLGCFDYDLNMDDDVQPTSELECIDNEVNMDEDVQPTSALECIDNEVNMNGGVQSNSELGCIDNEVNMNEDVQPISALECIDNEVNMNGVIQSNSELECIDNEVNMENDVHAALKLDWINNELNIDDDVQPINYCETVFGENASIEKEFAFSFNRNNKLNDLLYNNIDENNENIEKSPTQTSKNQNIYENISHHFSNVLLTNHSSTLNDFNNISSLPREINNIDKSNNIIVNNSPTFQESNTNFNKNIDHALFKINEDTFNFKDRLRFLPKGMSQIFEKSRSKAAMCDYNPDTDYYEDIIYNDFADDIQMQTEIYEPAVQNLENFNTIDIQKFKNKVQKDNTSLIFDEISLKETQMLNQVDNKFIATIMNGRHRGLEAVSKYLVLFDQHAVHERIRLERNLASYFNEDKWNSVPLSNVTLKMSKDEILYLHNYKNKFNQLGLQWTVLDTNTVSVSSIPEAILGKNPREVDKVMKAVKNLIIEEINVIKLQKGCISLHPKSIMDLIFSEACRYAIKFGDKLSKNDCIDLINDLSNCKTPFQCAHGRPVIAVLLDIKNDNRDYKINMTSLNEFKLKRKK